MDYKLTAESKYSVHTANYVNHKKIWQDQYDDLRANPGFPRKLNKGVPEKTKGLLCFSSL